MGQLIWHELWSWDPSWLVRHISSGYHNTVSRFLILVLYSLLKNYQLPSLNEKVEGMELVELNLLLRLEHYSAYEAE